MSTDCLTGVRVNRGVAGDDFADEEEAGIDSGAGAQEPGVFRGGARHFSLLCDDFGDQPIPSEQRARNASSRRCLA